MEKILTADEIRDTYGICSADRCTCLKYGWIGTKCENFKSFGATSFEELAVAQRKLYENRLVVDGLLGQ